MISKVQFNGRRVVMLLLVVMLLAVSVTPALAWFDEGATAVDPAQQCRDVLNSDGSYTVVCGRMTASHPQAQVAIEEPLLPLGIARAELMFSPDRWPSDLVTQTGQ